MWDTDWERVGGWEHVLGEHLARLLFGPAVIGESVEVARVEVDFPCLTENSGEFGLELRDLGFEVVANYYEQAVSIPVCICLAAWFPYPSCGWLVAAWSLEHLLQRCWWQQRSTGC